MDPKIKADGHRWWEDTAEDLQPYLQFNQKSKQENVNGVEKVDKDKPRIADSDKTSGSGSSNPQYGDINTLAKFTMCNAWLMNMMIDDAILRVSDSGSVDRDENEEPSAEDDSGKLSAALPAGHKTKNQKQVSEQVDKKLTGPIGGRPRPRRSVGAEDEGDVQHVSPSTGMLLELIVLSTVKFTCRRSIFLNVFE